MPQIYCHHHSVLPAEIDGQGHANNIWFLKWTQDAAVAHSAAQGWPTERYREANVGWVARSHQIEYQQAAYSDDEIAVFTWVSNMRRVTSLRRYRLVRPVDGTVLAVAETNWAYLNMTTRMPGRIPGELADSFQLLEPEYEPTTEELLANYR